MILLKSKHHQLKPHEHQTITLTDGRLLGFAEYGDPKGSPLFYFHGWPGSRLRISSLDEDAKAAGIRMISLDRPGYGLSTYKKERQLLDWPDDVTALADHLKIKKFAIAGISGGGPYAAVCAYKIPERLTKVGIVVGLAPTYVPGVLSDMPLAYKAGWANYAKSPVIAHIGSSFHHLAVKFPLGLSDPFSPKVDRNVIGPQRKESLVSLREAFRQGRKGPARDLMIYSKDWGFDLRDIHVPVHLWYAQKDKNVPVTMGEYYHKQIKGSTLVIYPQEGHMVSITHAKEIFEVLS